MSNEKGMTFVELVVVLALAAVVLLAVVSFAIPWFQRETMRSVIYDLQTFLQLTRVEAVSRNRPCRFVLDTTTRQVQVLDTMGTPLDATDDETLFESRLDDGIAFADPEGGDAVTLTQIGASSSFQAVFESDGSVSDGVGEVVVLGGQRYGRVAVFGAGGTQVERWTNGAWHVGS